MLQVFFRANTRVETPVGQASACLGLIIGAFAKVKRRQAEACPTNEMLPTAL
jgi:hypothetical protein